MNETHLTKIAPLYGFNTPEEISFFVNRKQFHQDRPEAVPVTAWLYVQNDEEINMISDEFHNHLINMPSFELYTNWTQMAPHMQDGRHWRAYYFKRDPKAYREFRKSTAR